jgi:hypothetical protein
MPFIGHRCALRVSGPATAATNEATTLLSAGRYQVTNTARRVWDPAVALTIRDGGTPVAANFWTFNYLFGIVTFAGYSPSGAVTVSGSFLTLLTIAEGRSFEFAVTRDLADASVYGTAAKIKQPTLDDVQASMEILSSPLADLDLVTGGTQSLDSFLQGAVFKLFEVSLENGAHFLRAWVGFDNVKLSAAVADLVTTMVSMQGAAQAPVGASWGVGT